VAALAVPQTPDADEQLGRKSSPTRVSGFVGREALRAAHLGRESVCVLAGELKATVGVVVDQCFSPFCLAGGDLRGPEVTAVPEGDDAGSEQRHRTEQHARSDAGVTPLEIGRLHGRGRRRRRTEEVLLDGVV
jgi:hypothetical protein